MLECADTVAVAAVPPLPMAAKPTLSIEALTPASPVEQLIRVIRSNKVLLDADIASLYGVPTKRLNEAVKRNPSRFPANFMFQLTPAEADDLRSQNAASSFHGGRRYLPYAFTEHGVVMLSAVLNSERAIHMSILVANAFVRMRELLATNRELATRVEKLERGQERTVSIIEVIVEDLDQVAQEVKDMKQTPPPPRKRRIGFRS